MKTRTVRQIADLVSGLLDGPEDLEVTGVEYLHAAGPGHLTFVGDSRYVTEWANSQASAAVVNAEFDVTPGDGRALIRVDSADRAMTVILDLFMPEAPLCPAGIHDRATVHSSATVHESACIGPGCVVGAGANVQEGVILYANVTVMDNVSVGERTRIWPGTVICQGCCVGKDCVLHGNVTIGADGFGFRPSEDGTSLLKVPHIGTVEIGNDVEIGAGSCIDRGKFSATRIGDNTKIDNLVQIAHNCNVGRSVAISGTCGIGGSVTIGDGAILGGGVGVKDHVSIGAGTKIGARSVVLQDVGAGETLLGYPAVDSRQTIKQWVALKKLPDVLKRLRS